MYSHLSLVIAISILMSIASAVNATVLQQLTVDSNGAPGDQLLVTDGIDEHFVVTEVGRVGIGDTSPNAMLGIRSQAPGSALISLRGSNGSTIGYLYESTNNSGLLFFYGQNGSSSVRISADSKLESYFAASDVAIGTTVASSDLKLDVEGKVGANLYCDSRGANCADPADIVAVVAGNGTGVVKRFVFEGDSLSSHGQWDVYLKAYEAFFNGGEEYNVASGGDIILPSTGFHKGMLDDYYNEVAQYKRAANNEDTYYFLFVGVNDLMSGASATDLYNELKKVWEAARSDGFKVVAFTMHPLSLNHPLYDPTEEAQRILLNEYVASDPSLYDYLVRPDLLFFDPSNSTYYKSDGAHLTHEGYQVLAKETARIVAGQSYKNSTKFVRGVTNIHDAVYLGAGNVGVGTNSPSAKLEVNGNIKVGNSSSDCMAENAGEIRWDGTNFQGCNGVSWINL